MRRGICKPRHTCTFNVQAETYEHFRVTFTREKFYDWEEVEHGFLVHSDGEYALCFDEKELGGYFYVWEKVKRDV